MNEKPRYSMTIQWSDEDGVYIVSFPEWEAAGHIAHTHGATYEDAVANGRDALDLLIESARAIDTALPVPRTFGERAAV
ncbi:MAG TPA: type II toxin-antitoxin system HicB family antitoxin [Chloroflexota bacterium]|nr:type II toxin-antitoxin system HicB family antitoxin [Chloroflexota bacterium]